MNRLHMFHASVMNGDIEAVAIHVDEGAHVNKGFGRDHFAAVHWACFYGHANVLEYLLLHGANPEQRTKNNWTPLHLCAMKGHLTCVHLLKAENVTLDSVDTCGSSAVMKAAAHGHSFVVKALLEYGASCNGVDERGFSPLHFAAFHGHLSVVQLLHSRGAQMDAQDNDSCLPIHLAAAEGHTNVAKYLAIHGPFASAFAVNKKGETPSAMAIRLGKEETASILAIIERDRANPMIADIDEELFPLHAAATVGDETRIKELLIAGRAIDEQDDRGSTALHKAAGNGHAGCVRLLLKSGAKPAPRNFGAETPRYVAIRFAHDACATLLDLSRSTLHQQYLEAEADQSDDQSDPFNEENVLQEETKQQKYDRILLEIAQLRSAYDGKVAEFHAVGGELEDEVEAKRLKEETAQLITSLKTQLERERLRREALESSLDETRKTLLRLMVQTNKTRTSPLKSSLNKSLS